MNFNVPIGMFVVPKKLFTGTGCWLFNNRAICGITQLMDYTKNRE